MTKRVLPNSLEHALRRTLFILGEDGAEAAIYHGTGVHRSASLLRKCADADDHRHQIQLRYASALDIACAIRGHLPPLLEAQKRLVAECLADRQDTEADALDPVRSVLELQATLGVIAAIVRGSLGRSDRADGRVGDEETLAVFEALETLIEQAKALERLICPPALERRRSRAL